MKTVNELQNAYTHYLEPKLGKIWSQATNSNVSLEAMKKNIRNYIYDATYSFESNGRTIYTKKKEFLENINSMTSKKEIYFYCRNSVNCARETDARLNYKK